MDAQETKCDCNECTQEIERVLLRQEKRDEANARIISEMYAKIEQLTDFVMTEQVALKNQIAKLASAQNTSNKSASVSTGNNLATTYFLDIDTKLARIEGKLIQLSASNVDTKAPTKKKTSTSSKTQ